MKQLLSLSDFLAANSFSRTDKSVLSEWWWTVDRGMLAAIFALIISGVLLIAAASPPVAERIGAGHFHFLIKHLIILVPGIFFLLGVSILSPRNIWRLGAILLAGSIFCMFLVMVVGIEIKGARRWLHLFGFSIQPSEFLKVAFAIVSAWLMAQRKEDQNFPGHIIAACLFAFCALLILLQPDLGMTMILTCIYGVQIFLAGFPIWLTIAFGGLAVGMIIVSYFVFDHVHSRIDRFLHPESGDNYQVQKSIEAFQNGGLFGTGPGQGSVKLSLPDAHADFIFAVGAEEMGMFFTVILVSIFLFVILRGMNRALGSNNIFVVLVAGGLLSMFGFQALVHMGSSLQLLPSKGMTLPFISYGGSSLWAMSIAMGVVLGLTRRTGRTSIAKGGSLLRRR